jgi:hypothetical protein
MTLGQLVNLEQEKLAGEYQNLLGEIGEYHRILADDAIIRGLIRDELLEVRRKHSDARRTEISEEEIGTIDMEDLIAEETMVVTISRQGYIKRTPASVYRAQHRGGKGMKGAKTEEEDPIQHLFVASTHDYLLFFTNRGKVYWQKIYDLPQLGRESRGRAVVNLLRFSEGEKVADCRAVRDFGLENHYLMMATKAGLVKKTELSKYSRPMKGGIIAIKLKEDDELVDVAITKPGDEVVLSTARGMAIRFSESDARPMGRNTSGVKGINLSSGDSLVGMVVAAPDATLLTVCEKGYGKRTRFGPNGAVESEADAADAPERHAGLLGELHDRPEDLPLLREPVVLELQVEVPRPEDVAVGGDRLRRAIVLSVQGELRRLARQAAGEPDQARGTLLEQRLVDPGPMVEALEVRVRDELQKVSVAGLVLGEDREVPVLLLALAGRPVEARAGRDVGLHAEDRLDAGRPPRFVELQRAEHPAVVGDGDRGHPGLGGFLEERLDAGGPVEQRELRVRVEVHEAVASGCQSTPSSVASERPSRADQLIRPVIRPADTNRRVRGEGSPGSRPPCPREGPSLSSWQ